MTVLSKKDKSIRNVYQQRRNDKQDDLINFNPREYEDGYTFPTYSNYTISPTTPISIYYEIQLDKDEVDNDRIVITDPDNIPALPLHNVITDDWYRNIDQQDEYEERYLQQRADRTYAHRYRRPQINDPIVAPLEPGT
ncbi:hypothetical protein F8M41_007964 [Gigaspora margarita]|uniref:Uncharacterized protein n=1 Tax=Gigaspora margarita TaxID=4874 RepID=A0A8H3X777_GIGMA|nr:hypothetical protein F8M41_007964 [Gigaspora margarita]